MGKAEELAAAVDVLEAGKGKRRKYPMDLRLRLVAFLREQRAAGNQLKSIAARVGVSPTLGSPASRAAPTWTRTSPQWV
jgi:transposase-like protein